jgi:dTDP-4-dehydrorhamnose reductase
MKIFLTGSTGQVGTAIKNRLNQLKQYKVLSLERNECDLSKTDNLKRSIDKYKPDLIINAAAFTKVDQAEDDIDLAYLINSKAVRILSESAKNLDVPLIHFSTDYVFDGSKKGKYNENDNANPIGIYGKSKFDGENAIREVDGYFYIFRVSWVYSKIRNNFYLTIKNLIKEKKNIKIVSDQYGIPSSSLFIADQIAKILPKINKNNKGIYHLTPNSYCSWYDFAKSIIKHEKINFNLNDINMINSDQYITKAIRPKNSVLDNQKIKNTFLLNFKSWEDVLREFINQ